MSTGAQHLAKICFKNEGKIKTFLEDKLREFTMQVIILNFQVAGK